MGMSLGSHGGQSANINVTPLIDVLLVLLIIFGTPSQMPTILGLATAGLTVVFQDFIIAFCGWFVLMGRHGMPAVDAYLLCSVCGDLRISEIVDVPNWVVSFYFPRVVLA